MSEIIECKGCGNKSIYVYQCDTCGEIRCFFPLCTGTGENKVQGGAKSDDTCLNCKKGKYKKIS